MKPDSHANKAQRLLSAAEEALDGMILSAEQSGELRHLHGRPLDLSDGSSEWWVRKRLAREGFSHPVIERVRELDAAQREAERIVERVRERRDQLAGRDGTSSRAQAIVFNTERREALTAYRASLTELKRKIRDHNLAVPDPFHRRQIDVDEAVAEAARAVPALEIPEMPAEPAPRASWMQRLRRRPRRRGETHA
ncbi:MAG: hypothetical protein JOZ41_17345 [Chloroflexi bacterium]|nr:hypothetical protein [Chloroflexota bacterium]